MLERMNLRKAKNFIPLAIASLALIFLFALSFSYGSRPPRGRALTKSPLLWAKLDGSLTDEVSSGSSFAYSPGKPSTASGISLKEGDNIQYSRGTAIDAGNSIYENWNPNQGTMNVWVEPNWNGGDNEAHWIWSADSGRIDTADANLQAYFKFDEGSENFAFDSSANSNVGYLHGPALSFDGGDYVTNSTADWRSSDSVGSIEAWVKFTNIDAVQYLIGSADVASNVYYFGLRTSATNNFVLTQTNNDTPDSVFGSTTFQANVWYHIVGVSNESTYALYVNGVPETLTVNSGSNSGDWFADTSSRDNLTFGVLQTSTSNYFLTGQIDEVRVYNRALSATEVGQHYAGNFANESGLVGYWDMDDGQGQTVADSSGNGNNGTLGADSGSSTDDPTWVNYAPRWTDEGRFGEAVVFDGSDDELEINDINF